MSQKHIRYPYALNLLRRINGISHHGRSIQDYFMYEGNNFWQAYQTEIFEYVKRFSRDPESTTQAVLRESKLAFFPSCVAFLFSFAGFVSMVVRRKKVLVYSTDKSPQGAYACDFRLKELYRALDTTHTSYQELFHVASASRLLQNQRIRKRPALYTKGFDLFQYVIELFTKEDDEEMNEMKMSISTSFPHEERVFVENLITAFRRKFRRVPRRVGAVRFILRQGGIRKVYLIDDARHYFELLLAAQLCSVPTAAIQHGHFTKYHVGVLPCASVVKGKIIAPGMLFVWSRYWKKELVRLGSYYKDDTVFVAGNKVHPNVQDGRTRNMDGKIGVLIPYEADAPKEKFRAYIDVLRTCPGIHIYFKVRPDMSPNDQLLQYGLAEGENVTVSRDARDHRNRIHVALGVYSTFLYDIIGSDIPVLVATNVMDYGEGMVTNDLAEAAGEVKGICTTIRNVALTDENILKERRHKLYGEDTIDLTKTLIDDIQLIH